jgi:hypothetical protein
MGCLVVLGVLMMGISCLAVFGATGAITADRLPRIAQASATKPTAKPADGKPESAEVAKPESAKPEPARPEAPLPKAEPPPPKPEPKAAEKPEPAPKPVGTIPPKPAPVGPEGNVAMRLDRTAVGGGLKLTALGAAKTTQGERAVLAIYVRMENDGAQPLRVDPAYFRLIDRSGTKYPISKAVEASLPAIELAPRSAPGEQGKQTEGNLTFEIPRAATNLALTYEPPEGSPLRIPMPPDFG